MCRKDTKKSQKSMESIMMTLACPKSYTAIMERVLIRRSLCLNINDTIVVKDLKVNWNINTQS
jgi:hypothetical protein